MIYDNVILLSMILANTKLYNISTFTDSLMTSLASAHITWSGIRVLEGNLLNSLEFR